MALPWSGDRRARDRADRRRASSRQLLPLIAAYQRFYEVEEIDEERNRAFFRRFLAPSEDGLLLGARRRRGSSATPASTGTSARPRPCETVLMNDLYVDRGRPRRGRRPRPDRGQPPRSPANAASPSSSGRPPPTTRPPSASTTRPAPSARSGSATSCGSERRSQTRPQVGGGGCCWSRRSITLNIASSSARRSSRPSSQLGRGSDRTIALSTPQTSPRHYRLVPSSQTGSSFSASAAASRPRGRSLPPASRVAASMPLSAPASTPARAISVRRGCTRPTDCRQFLPGHKRNCARR